MSAEDKIHATVLGALAVLVAAVMAAGPRRSLPARQSDAEARAPTTAAPAALGRAELDAAIRRLETWVRQRTTPNPSPRVHQLALQAFGANVGDSDPGSPTRSSLGVVGPRDVVTLLEAGVALDQQLATADGSRSLRQLLLDTARGLLESDARQPSDAWQLDVLAFAVLAEQPHVRRALATRAHATLTRLEHRARARNQSAAEKRQPLAAWHVENRAWIEELALSTAIFRAAAVLGDAELDQRARRQLQRLLGSQRLQRERLLAELGQAGTGAARVQVALGALEALGRLQQALYGAHLSFRRQDRLEPLPRVAQAMRQAAADLLGQLTALERAAALASPDRALVDEHALLEAAVQALRGLRAARVAT